MPKPRAYGKSSKDQTSTHGEFLRRRAGGAGGTQTRTTDQILRAAKVTQSEINRTRGTMGSQPSTKPKTGK